MYFMFSETCSLLCGVQKQPEKEGREKNERKGREEGENEENRIRNKKQLTLPGPKKSVKEELVKDELPLDPILFFNQKTPDYVPLSHPILVYETPERKQEFEPIFEEELESPLTTPSLIWHPRSRIWLDCRAETIGSLHWGFIDTSSSS